MAKSLSAKKPAKPRPTARKVASSGPSTKSLVRSSRPPKTGELARKEQALRRLRLPAKALDSCPKITDILKRTFRRTTLAIDALRFSDDAAAIEFLSVYDSLPVDDRDRVPLEAVCLKADVSPSALLGACLMACQSIKGREAALTAVTAFPDVLRAGIAAAQMPGGTADRKMLYEAPVNCFLPGPKGSSISFQMINGNPQISKPSDADDEDEGGDNFENLFPSINGSLEKWNTDRRLLLAESND